MQYSPLAITRNHVLGEIYRQCNPIESIPVYMNNQSGALLGSVDESMGHYADAFIFHLSETVSKQLSSNRYTYGFGFEYFDKTDQTVDKKRIKLNHILLVENKPLFNKKSLPKK